MSDQIAPVHHITTSDTPGHHTHDHGNTNTNTFATGTGSENYGTGMSTGANNYGTGMNTSSMSEPMDTTRTSTTHHHNSDHITPSGPVDPVRHHRLNESRVPNISQIDSDDTEARRASLAPTHNPLGAHKGFMTTDEASHKSDVPPTSSVGSQNAPGAAGEIGESAMGAMGYGGSTVERPKEDQGLGEKIVNFFGA